MTPYLIEPYIYFQGKKKEKHWMQIAEEEALFYKMLMEQTQQQQAQQTTPVAGAGGVPEYNFFHPKISTLNFSISPSITGSAPYTIYLNPVCDNTVIRYCDWSWNFGDGTTATGPTATKIFDTGSFIITVTATTQFNKVTQTATSEVTASLPVVVANFTSSVESGSVPLTVTFTNLTFINQYTGSGDLPGVTYRWDFGSGSLTSTSTNPTAIYYDTGSYIVRLEATGSYGMASDLARFAVSASL